MACLSNDSKENKESSGGYARGQVGEHKKKAEMKEDLLVKTSGMVLKDQK